MVSPTEAPVATRIGNRIGRRRLGLLRQRESNVARHDDRLQPSYDESERLGRGRLEHEIEVERLETVFAGLEALLRLGLVLFVEGVREGSGVSDGMECVHLTVAHAIVDVLLGG